MTSSAPRSLASDAAFEYAERLRLYPGVVAQARVDAQLAQDDTECWWLIARALAEGISISRAIGTHTGPGVSCYQIRDALDRAAQSRSAACTRHPEDAQLAQRRTAVAAIDTVLRPRIQFWCQLNDDLRTRAEAARKAAA